MKKEFFELLGVKFEVTNKCKVHVAPITGARYAEIFEVYARPSQTKVSIWEEWCDWCNSINNTDEWKCGIQIECYNKSMFTITGSLREKNKGLQGKIYYLYITKNHNKIYRQY